jgi:hypothetical protein
MLLNIATLTPPAACWLLALACSGPYSNMQPVCWWEGVMLPYKAMAVATAIPYIGVAGPLAG